ncbi:hypothetical protein HWV62_7752 [Athelia sp. TMB]|nr:hypothetical protein HWV62_7752 [Athelia sp. TMB]
MPDDNLEFSDPEDILSTSLQTLYDYAPITHSSGGDSFTYKNTFATSQSTLDLLRTNFGSQDGGPHILELGAAAGLPGIVIAQAYPSLRVTVSDYPDEDLISALSDNVTANDVANRCCVVPYAWGSDCSVFGPEASFDLILACDTLWNPDLHTLFIKTLCDLLTRSDDARIHLVAGLHTGRFTLQSFMLTAQAAGLKILIAVEKEVVGKTQREWSAEREDSEQERRRWVVWMILSWSCESIEKNEIA